VALGESDAQAWREEKRGGERCGEAWGWCSPFIKAGDLQSRPLMAGEGVNGDSRGGIKAGE
jgi:hypothetical protein